MTAGPFRLGQRRVGDVADHFGRERVLVVAELDEVALGQEVEGDVGVEGVVAPGGELADRVERAAGADDGAVLEHVALGRPQGVEPGRHQSLQRRGEVRGGRAARPEPGPVPPVSRSSAASSSTKNGLPPLRSWSSAMTSSFGVLAQQLGHQHLDGGGVEWLEGERDRVVAPGRGAPAFVELGARRGEQHERAGPEIVDEAVDEGEDEVIGPVQVGEHDDERPAPGHPRQQRLHGPKRVVAGPARVEVVELGFEPEQVEQAGDRAASWPRRRPRGRSRRRRRRGRGCGRRRVTRRAARRTRRGRPRRSATTGPRRRARTDR